MTVLSIARVALLRMFRDRSNLFFVFVLPIAIIILIGAQFGGGFIPTIGVVSPVGDGLADALIDRVSDQYEIRTYSDEPAVINAVERGQVSAGMVVPDGFAESVTAGAPQVIGFVSVPDSTGRAIEASVSGSLAGLMGPVSAAQTISTEIGLPYPEARALTEGMSGFVPSVTVETRTTGEALFPSTLGQFDIGASGQLVLFMFLTGLVGSSALIKSRQLGVTRRMLSTPATPGTIVLGEAVGRWVVSVFQGIYIVLVTWVVFGVSWGSIFGAMAVLFVFGWVGAGAAMLFGAVFKNDQQAGGIAVVASLGLAALGGSMVPIEIFPSTMQTVARFTPHAWANDAFAQLVRHDAGLTEILSQLGVLVGFAVTLMVLASWRLRLVITAS